MGLYPEREVEREREGRRVEKLTERGGGGGGGGGGGVIEGWREGEMYNDFWLATVLPSSSVMSVTPPLKGPGPAPVEARTEIV